MDLRRELTLFKLLLFSRFTKPLLVIYAFLFVLTSYAVLLSSSAQGSIPVSTAIEILSVPVVLSSLLSRLVLTKSDVDFLFTLPISRREIVLGLYLVSLVANGLTYLYFGAFAFSVVGAGGAILVAALTLMTTSMSVALAPLKFRYRGMVSLALGAWFVSPAFGFPFSPLSMLTGYSYAYAILASLTAVFVYFSFVNFDKVRLTSVQGQTQTRRVKEVSFGSRSPFLAVLKRNVSFLELGVRYNYMGFTAFKTFRVNLVYLVVLSAVVSAVYYFVGGQFRSVGLFALLVEIYLVFIFAQSSFMFEPLWLSFGLLDSLSYARYLLLSRLISLEAIFVPLALVNALLGEYFTSLAAFGIPLSYAYMASLTARIRPVQIRDEDAPTVVFSASQFLIALFFLPVVFLGIFLYSLAVILPPSYQILFGLVFLLIMTLLGSPFLIWRNFWEKVKVKMVENNFV